MFLKASAINVYASSSVHHACLCAPARMQSSPSETRNGGNALKGRRWLHPPPRSPSHGDDAAASAGQPPSWPASKDPTPYEILRTQRGGAYNRAHFLGLVKFYHPDRYHHVSSYHNIPASTCLERYRLVITANEILCDPGKRRAYDLYGHGWTTVVVEDVHEVYRKADRAWRTAEGTAANNATWEDWERWYQRKEGKKQEPNYVSNEAFIGMLCFFVLTMGWGQAARARHSGLNYVEMQNQNQAHISSDMRKKLDETAPLSREGRVDHFLRQRESWATPVASGESAHK